MLYQWRLLNIRLHLLQALGAVCLIACTPSPPTPETYLTASQVVNQHILPTINYLNESAASLDSATERFCHNPGNTGELHTIQSAWMNTYLSWRKARPLRRISSGQQPSTKFITTLLSIRRLAFHPSANTFFTAPEPCQELKSHIQSLIQLAKNWAWAWDTRGENFAGKYLSTPTAYKTLLAPTLIQSLKQLTEPNKHPGLPDSIVEQGHLTEASFSYTLFATGVAPLLTDAQQASKAHHNFQKLLHAMKYHAQINQHKEVDQLINTLTQQISSIVHETKQNP